MIGPSVGIYTRPLLGGPALEYAPAIDQPIITSGAGSPSFATQTQTPFLRLTPGDNTTGVDVVNDPCYAFPGMPAGLLVPNVSFNTRCSMPNIPGGNSQGRTWDWQLETVTSSKFIGVRWVTNVTKARIVVVVNGKPVSSAVEITATNGGVSHFKLEFPDNRERRVKMIWGGGSSTFAPEFEAAYPPVRPATTGKTLLTIGDSLSAGAGAPPTGATYIDTWPHWTAMALGFDHCCNASIGGTGWVWTNQPGVGHYGGGRLAPALSLAPDAVVFAGSRNDSASAAITAAVEAALDATLASVAAGRIFVTGTFTTLSQNAYVQAGAASRSVAFVDMQDGFQAGDIGGDNVHPTYDGAVNLRNRLIPRLRAAGCVP